MFSTSFRFLYRERSGKRTPYLKKPCIKERFKKALVVTGATILKGA
jgi:hypothetical protein